MESNEEGDVGNVFEDICLCRLGMYCRAKEFYEAVDFL
jgi:hypothetical protein